MSLTGIHDVIRGFSENGESPAVTFFQKEQPLRRSYRQLHDDVAALVGGLRARGFKNKERAAVFSANRYEWIVAALGIIRSGGVLVPVDVQSDRETLRHIIADSGAKFIFTTAHQQERLRDTGVEQIVFGEDSWRGMIKDKAGSGGPPETGAIDPGDNAVLFYTSGTTGRPKGVPLTHRQILFQLETVRRQHLLWDRDRILLPLPLHHVYPLVIGLLTPLSMGLHIFLPQALTGPQILRALKEGRITVILGVPRLYRALVEGIESRIASGPAAASVLFKTLYAVNHLFVRLGIFPEKALLSFLHKKIGPELRMLASGGSALPPSLHEKLRTFGWRVGIGYGLTETAPLLTVQHPDDYRPGSAGKAVDGVELRIHQQDPGRPGEVWARGPNVFKGYRHLEEETRKVLTGDGWFKTGDTGYLKNGDLYLTGRVSTLIVTESGKNIQPDDVEDALAKAPVIKEAAIFQQDGRLAGIIVPDEEISGAQEGGADGIRKAIEEAFGGLPSYQQPDEYVLTREALPRTRLGKIRRHLLPELFRKIKSGETEEKGRLKGPLSIEEMSGEDRNLLEDPDARKVWDWLAARYQDRRLTPDASPQRDLGIDSMGWINLSLEVRQKTGKELSDEAAARIKTVRDLLKEVSETGSAVQQVKGDDLFTDPESHISEKRKRWLRPHSAVERFLASGLFSFNTFLMRLLFRVKADGLERLPKEPPFIFSVNHVSFLDPFVLGAVLGHERLRNSYWAGWTEVAFNTPLARGFSRLSHVVPIDPQKGAVSSLAFVAAALKRGKNIVIFPEGQRSHSGRLIPFKPGLGMILGHFDVPVVPVIILGTYEAWPAQKRFPRPHPVRVVFREPVKVETLKAKAGGSQEAQELMKALFDVTNEFTKEMIGAQ